MLPIPTVIVVSTSLIIKNLVDYERNIELSIRVEMWEITDIANGTEIGLSKLYDSL